MKKRILLLVLCVVLAFSCKTAPANKGEKDCSKEAQTSTAVGGSIKDTNTQPAVSQMGTEQKSDEQIAAEKAAERKKAARQAAAKKRAAERKALAEQRRAERRAAAREAAKKRDRKRRELAAKKRAEARKAAAEKKAAEQKALAEKKDAEKKAAEEKALAEKKAAEKKKAQAEAKKKAAAKKKAEAAKKKAAAEAAKKKAAQRKALAAKKAAEKKKAAKAKKAAQEAARKKAARKKAAQAAAKKKRAAERKALAAKKAAEKKKAEDAEKNKAAEAAKKMPIITDVTWLAEQADASFVVKKTGGQTGKMFVTFLAKYDGDLSEKDFKEATVMSPKDIWIINAENASSVLQIDEKNKLLILKHLAAGQGEGAIPVGSWFVSITVGNAKPFEKTLNVTAVSEEEGTQFIVPEASADTENEALAIPVIESVSRNKDTIEIFFAVNDERVKNGYFLFDVPKTEYYEDSGSLLDAKGNVVNGCQSFFVDGTTSQCILRKDADNKKWFDKAVKCYFVVSNVNRVAEPDGEHHRAVSAAAAIK